MKISDDSYLIDGKEYIRVTRILDVISKPELYKWIGKYGWDYCEGVKDKRAGFGSRVHKEIRNLFEGKEVWVDDEEMRKTMSLFGCWVNSHNISPVYLECTVKSDVHMFGGTVDFIGDFDNRRTLIDWKTSKYVFDHYLLQVSAYMWAFEESFPDEPKIEQCKVVTIRDGKINSKVLSREKALELFEVFKAARLIYRWKYGK
jgi:hypothetical protein